MTPTGGGPVRRSAASATTANFSERQTRGSVSAATKSAQVRTVARSLSREGDVGSELKIDKGDVHRRQDDAPSPEVKDA